MKLKNQILITFVVSGILPFLIAFMYVIWNASETTDRLTLNAANERLAMAVNTLDQYLKTRQSEVEFLALQPAIRSMDFANTMRPVLMDVLAAKNDIYEKFIVGELDGRFYNTSGGNLNQGLLSTFDDENSDAQARSISARDYWQKTTLNLAGYKGAYISNPMISYTTEVKQVVVAASVLNDEQQVIGMVGGSIPWSSIQKIMADLNEQLTELFPGNANFALISREGTYWYHWDAKKIIHFARDEQSNFILGGNGEKQTVSTNLKTLFPEMNLYGSTGVLTGHAAQVARASGLGVVQHLFSPIGTSGYTLEMAINQDALNLETHRLVTAFLIAFSVALVVSLFVISSLSRSLSKPLYDFEMKLHRLNDAELEPIEFKASASELNSLFSRFNTLISTLSKREQQLRTSEKRFSLAMQGANDGLWDWNLLTDAVYLSPRWKQMLGFEDDEIANDIDHWRNLVFPEDRAKTEQTLKAYLSGEIQEFQVEFRMMHKDGHLVDVLSRGFADRNPDTNKPERIVGTHIDMTLRNEQQKQLNDLNAHLESRVDQRTRELETANHQLKKATIEAARANEAKSLFLANMSHEIRTPLNGIIGLTELVARMELGEKQRDFIDKIQLSSKNLQHIVNDILDLSKIEAGKLAIENKGFEPRKLLHDVIQVFHHKAKQKGVKLKIEVDSALPNYSQGDAIRISQILNNLLSNALKFTAQGEVAIKVKPLPQKDFFEWSVADTGIGIKPEQRSRLFADFSQADVSTSREYGGTGLGLTISRRLARLMDGDVTFDAHYKQGARFILTLQFPHIEKPANHELEKAYSATGQASIIFANKHLLLAEDNAINIVLAKELFESLGFVVTVAKDGNEAIEACTERVFDVIIMDIQMPKVDGYQATERIRKTGLNQDTPIIAMTANAMNSDIEKCHAVGMNEHIGKPIDFDQVVGTLKKYLQ